MMRINIYCLYICEKKAFIAQNFSKNKFYVYKGLFNSYQVSTYIYVKVTHMEEENGKLFDDEINLMPLIIYVHVVVHIYCCCIIKKRELLNFIVFRSENSVVR